MIRCPWCGAKNYAIDMWCARCKHHLELAPPRRRGTRLVAVLAPTAAAIGVAIAVAVPVAGWFGGTQSVDLMLQRASSAAPDATAAAATNAPSATPATVEATATAAPTPAADSTPAPDSGPAADAAPLASPEIQPALPVPAVVVPDRGADPVGAVRRFYEAVSAHQFDVAAALWSPAMQSVFPPTVFIDQRFSTTEQLDVRADRLVANSGDTAVVYVDVIEVIGGGQRHWTGTWELVDTSTGWLLDRPNLQAEG